MEDTTCGLKDWVQIEHRCGPRVPEATRTPRESDPHSEQGTGCIYMPWYYEQVTRQGMMPPPWRRQQQLTNEWYAELHKQTTYQYRRRSPQGRPKPQPEQIAVPTQCWISTLSRLDRCHSPQTFPPLRGHKERRLKAGYFDEVLSRENPFDLVSMSTVNSSRTSPRWVFSRRSICMCA